MSSNRSVTDPNALWAFVLNELRTSVYLLKPMFSELADLSLATIGTDHSARLEYEMLLTQMDDAMELCNPVQADQIEKRVLNLGQVAEDFSESYSRRFGHQLAQTVSITVDHDLPTVKSYPQQMVRILDCLVRAGHQGGVKRDVDFTIRTSRKLEQSTKNCEMVLSCKGLPFSLRQEQLIQLLAEFNSGTYLRCVRELGLPLCTALHIARSIGGTASIRVNDNSKGTVELRFLFERVMQNSQPASIPNVFYLMADSELLKGKIQKFADFYCAKLVVVNSAADVPPTGSLIFDAQELNDATQAKLRSLPRPEHTTLILSKNEVVTWRELAKLGFAHFATVPLVSTRLLHCVSGSAAYVRPQSTQAVSDLQKLRVLIVDDAATARIVLKDHFELEGHGVIEATDGSELVAQIKNGGRFDIIFCDQTMSHMDGATAAREVRAYEEKLGRHTPIVLMTAYSSSSGPSESELALFDLKLNKPIKTDQIKDILQRLVYSKLQTVVPAKPPLKALEVIDLADLQERCGGKTKTMVRVLESFIEGSRASLMKLKSDEAAKDHLVLVRSLHTIKGLLRDAGAKEAARMLEDIERRAVDPAYSLNADLAKIENSVELACSSAKNLKDELISSL